MYETFFQFNEQPFDAAPRVDRYFPAQSIEQSRQSISRAIERCAGPSMIIGSAGTGKSLLCQLLAEQFGGSYRIAMLASARLCTRKALLQNILFELGLPFRDMEEGELRLSLIDHLEPSDACPKGMLLIVDEAHSLPLRLIEEIRMITNLVREGHSRVQLIIAGGPLLEERLANPRLESLNQRIVARCYLNSFSREETFQYIRQQIASVGGECDKIFTEEGLAAVHTASDGIPRLVNQICDHALLLASVGGQRKLDQRGVEEAWSDLQQLPTPWSSSSAGESESANIIEFGSLDDETSAAGENSSAFGEDDLAIKPVAPSAQLDAIDRQLSDALGEGESSPAAENEREEGSFRPAGTIGPEVELSFHGKHAPFEEKFEEEEVVIDRFSTLDSGAFANQTNVTCDDGRELAEILGQFHRDERPNLSIAQETRGEAVGHGGPGDLRRDDSSGSSPAQSASGQTPSGRFNPAADPVMPESRGGAAAPSVASLDTANLADDSDIIVIESEQHDSAENQRVGPEKMRRREYRQLFAKLRRG